MFSAASAVNFNYDAQLKGSLTKQPASLAVQGHVYDTDGGSTVHWETWKSDKGNTTPQFSPCLTAPSPIEEAFVARDHYALNYSWFLFFANNCPLVL